MFNIFLLTFINVAVILLYLVCGFLLVKSGKCHPTHSKTLSALLVYILSPAMIINAFLKLDYSQESLLSMLWFFLASLFVQVVLLLTLYFIFKRKYGEGKYRIMTVGSALGNVGFFGLPVITALFPDKSIVACYSVTFVFSMNLLVFTAGRALITNDPKQVSVKSALLNPTTLSMVVALPLFIFNVRFPSQISKVISILAETTTPICMFVLGFRLASVPFRKLFMRPLTYLAVAIKLIIFPLCVFLVVKFLPFFDDTFKSSLFILCGMPSGAIILSLAEMYESETELSANVILLSTLFCVITIPLLTLLI